MMGPPIAAVISRWMGATPVPVMIRSDEVPRRMVGEDHRIGAGPELGVGEGDGEGHQLPEHPRDLFGLPEPHLEEEILGPREVVGEGPGAHHLADDPHPIPGLPPQEGDRLQDRAERGLLEDRLGDRGIGKIGMRGVFRIGHPLR